MGEKGITVIKAIFVDYETRIHGKIIKKIRRDL